MRAARRGSRPAREAVLGGCLPIAYTLASRAGLDAPAVDDVARVVLTQLAGGLGAEREPDDLRSRVIDLTTRQIRVVRGDGTGPDGPGELDPEPLLVPPPHLADLAVRLAAMRPSAHTRPDDVAAHRIHLPGVKPLTAVLIVLVLVAAAEIAIVFGTRDGGDLPPDAVAAAPAPRPALSTPSAARTPGPTPSTSHFVPIPAGDLAGAPPFGNQVPPIPTVLSAYELGTIQQDAHVVGRDNGQSTGYGSHSIWIFSDTVLRNPNGFITNSAAITADLSAGDGITLSTPPDIVVPFNHAEQTFSAAHAPSTGCSVAHDQYCGTAFGLWPGPVVADPARHRVLIFYEKVCRSSRAGTACSAMFGKVIGSGVASLDMTTGLVTRLTPTNANAVTSLEGTDPTLFFPAWRTYAAAALTVGDMVYVYGDCSLTCKLARVRLDRVTDRSRWQFFAGRDTGGTPQWSSDPTAAVDTITAGAAGSTVLWSGGLHGFLNILMPYASNTIMYQIGGSPFGPWSATYPLLATGAQPDNPNYATFGHAEYAEHNGLTQYISYYQAATGGQRLVKVSFEGGSSSGH